MLELRGRELGGGQGLSRRSCLKIGALGWGGLSLADVLAHRAATAGTSSPNRTAVILFWMAGGPSHVDTVDPKPQATEIVRGPFRAIDTSLPGLQFTEMLPRLAQQAHRLSVVRSLHHSLAVHDDASHWVQTGMPLLQAREQGQKHPCQGSIVAAQRGANAPGVPPYVCIPEGYSSRRGFYQRSAWLGARHDPVDGGGDPKLGNFRLPEFALPAGLTLRQLEDRRTLRETLGDLARGVERSSAVAALDDARRAAYDLVSGPAARQAFDISAEPESLRERYGRNFWGQSALLARRLVESGVTFVTINLYEADVDWWDDHFVLEKNFRKRLPSFDQSLSALIDDLHERGLAEQVLVAAFGEFGRAPKIDSSAGRGHWPRAMSAILSGGGLASGRVVGHTTADGGDVDDRALTPNDLLATIYRALAIDPTQFLRDPLGRPVRVLDHGAPIRELIA